MSIVNQINLAVVLTMAATPLLANVGVKLKDFFKSEQSVASLQAKEATPATSTGTSSSRVREGREDDRRAPERAAHPVRRPGCLRGHRVHGQGVGPSVYFGDAGSDAVLHAVGAEKASCAVVTVDSPGGPTARCGR